MRDSGVLFICNLIDRSLNGEMPNEILQKISKYWFEMKTIGINRAYLAKGVNEQVDMLVRIARDNKIQIGQYAVLGNGDQFRITNVSHGHEDTTYSRMARTHYYKTIHIVGLDYTELTLTRLENNYDVETEKDTDCTC